MRAHRLQEYRVLASLVLALFSVVVFSGTTVFKSTAPDGRITFGDQPSEDAIDFELIEIKPAAASTDTNLDKRLERMAATTKRLQQDRKARELARQEEKPDEPAAVVYYPAANPSHSHYRGSFHNKRHETHRYKPGKQSPVFPDDGDNSSYTSSRHYRQLPFAVNVNSGFRSSGASVSLSPGSELTNYQESKYKLNTNNSSRYLPYSPLLKSR